MRQPLLRTQRLLLRPLQIEDVAQLVRLAGDKQVADTTATIPHPYREQDARFIVQASEEGYNNGTFHAFAISQGTALLGVVSLKCTAQELGTAELGYWIGVPYWGNGYATEAAQPVLDYAFNAIGFNCVKAKLLCRNPASARILHKLGMQRIGINSRAIQKWGIWEDEEVWSITAKQTASAQSSNAVQ